MLAAAFARSAPSAAGTANTAIALFHSVRQWSTTFAENLECTFSEAKVLDA